MREMLKKIVTRGLASVNAFPTRSTDERLVRNLLTSLHPVKSGRDLIRFGPKKDGGYLLPEDLMGIEACFSPGVSDQSGFELDCADAGMRVFLADKSVDRPNASHERFSFIKKFLGVTTGEDFVTLDDWVASSLPESKADLLLQMDIEGFEYEVLLGASHEVLSRFRIIVAEFHFLDQLWSLPFFRLASRAFEKVLQSHVCVHIHPNNYDQQMSYKGICIPKLAEFTFLRRDRVTHASFATQFPHPLDADNTDNPTLVLATSCYHSQ